MMPSPSPDQSSSSPPQPDIQPFSSPQPGSKLRQQLKRGLEDDHDQSQESHPESPSPAPVSAPAVNPREAALQASNEELKRKIEELEAERDAVIADLKEKDANKTVQKHIRLLHEYNEVRDVALGLMGLVANNRGCELKEVMEEFGVDPKDK